MTLLTGRQVKNVLEETPYNEFGHKRDAETQQSSSHLRSNANMAAILNNQPSTRELKRSLTPSGLNLHQVAPPLEECLKVEMSILKAYPKRDANHTALDQYNHHFQDEMNLLSHREGSVVLPFKLSSTAKKPILPLSNSQIRSLTENKPFNSTIRKLPLLSHTKEERQRINLSSRNVEDGYNTHQTSVLSTKGYPNLVSLTLILMHAEQAKLYGNDREGQVASTQV